MQGYLYYSCVLFTLELCSSAHFRVVIRCSWMRKVSSSGISDFFCTSKGRTNTMYRALCFSVLFGVTLVMQCSKHFFSWQSFDSSCEAPCCLCLDCSLLVPPQNKTPGIFALWMRVIKLRKAFKSTSQEKLWRLICIYKLHFLRLEVCYS